MSTFAGRILERLKGPKTRGGRAGSQFPDTWRTSGRSSSLPSQADNSDPCTDTLRPDTTSAFSYRLRFLQTCGRAFIQWRAMSFLQSMITTYSPLRNSTPRSNTTNPVHRSPSAIATIQESMTRPWLWALGVSWRAQCSLTELDPSGNVD